MEESSDNFLVMTGNIEGAANKTKLVAICFIIGLISFGSGFLARSYLPQDNNTSDAENKVETSIAKIPVKTHESATIGRSENPEYIDYERWILTDSKSNTQAISKLFGFKFHPFHKDWECSNKSMNFTPVGIEISCKQKFCSRTVGLLYPDNIAEEKSPECAEELANREYPDQQLHSFKIHVEKVSVSVGAKPWLESVEYSNTPKGRQYEFIERDGQDLEEPSEYHQIFEFVFFSPDPLTDMLSDSVLYGVDDIYARYIVTMGVYESSNPSGQIEREEIISLGEKLIDSIEFTAPINL